MNDSDKKSFKIGLEKKKWTNVFSPKTAKMAAIEFNQTFFINFVKYFHLKKLKCKKIHDKKGTTFDH